MTVLTRWSQKMTALPAERLSDPQRLSYLAASHSLYLLKKTLLQLYTEAEEGGMIPEDSVDGVKAPPGLSALSQCVSCLTWPVGPNTDQAFMTPSPAARAPNKANIWSPWISKSFSFRIPFNSACVFPLCSEWRVRFPLWCTVLWTVYRHICA